MCVGVKVRVYIAIGFIIVYFIFGQPELFVLPLVCKMCYVFYVANVMFY